MTSYAFSHKAQQDLQDIALYTKETWGQAQAIKYLDEIESICNNLSQTPKIGKKRDEISQGIRSFPHQKHIIFYLIKGDKILIVRILHQKMDIQAGFVS